MPRFCSHPLRLAALSTLSALALTLAGTGSAQAQATIDQAKALAGNMTPGDGAGFPVTLSQPGSYKLTSNLYVPAGQFGFHITASNVTLDLNGFSVIGPGTCSRDASTFVVVCSQPHMGIYGIYAEAATDGVVVRNGGVSGFASIGVYLAGTNDAAQDLRVSHNGGYGLSAASMASGVMASMNASSGIIGSSMVTHSVARMNGGTGINAGVIQQSMSEQNLVGISGTAVRDSAARYNKNGDIPPATKSLGGNLSGNALY
ncbi:MAG: hypothetical protein KBC73_20055 [Burkholderiaceae bacterium]|nr:hypothetical protein [Burkholderiaceae bacterium]